MTIPREDTLAFFPPSVTAGNLTLGPLTLAGAVRLGEVGVDLGQRVPRDLLFQAAFVLAGGKDERPRTKDGRGKFALDPSGFSKFCNRANVGLKELSSAVEKVLNDAYETYVKPRREKDDVPTLTPHGLGWPLEYAEFLCGEYGWSWETAINTPVSTAFALVAANRQRNGGKHGGFDYIERAYANNLRQPQPKAST